MNFPVSEIDVDKYHDHIFNLIQDEKCTIFIDTNIIALLYGIHDSARKELLDWLKLYIVKNRVKIPNWVINEYSNRFIRDKIHEYLSPLAKIKTIQKEFVNVRSFLKMNIDSASLAKSKYTDITEFQADLKLIEEKLDKIAFAAANKDQNYKLKIHNEIIETFSKCILESNIDNILSKVNNNGLIRYYHKLPPGFQDEKKELNAHGDLILWYEILSYCESERIEKAILITNDEKKDWVYPPFKVNIKGKLFPNKEPQFKIADPRLVAEFKMATQSEEFHIVNLEQLTKILIGKTGNSFIDLAGALQVVNEQNKPEEESNEAESILESFTKPKIDEELKEVFDKTKMILSKNALADRDYPLIFDDVFTKTIENLKSYNWYVQNPAINSFLEFAKQPIRETRSNQEDLFVIGRNLYQAAHGGSGSAVNYLENLREEFTQYDDFFINSIYAGMVYEIYFDSFGAFRGNNLKSHLINEVLDCENLDRLDVAKSFLRSSLEQYRMQLLYFPFEEKIIKLIPTFTAEPIIDKNEWFGERKYIEMTSLKAGEVELLSDNPDEQMNIYFQDFTLSELPKTISGIYAVPFDKIQIDKDITKANFPILLRDRQFRKLFTDNDTTNF